MSYRAKLKMGLLSATIISGAAAAMPAMAQTAAAADEGDVIVVTGTRRSTTLMETPINISAVGAEELAAQRIDDIRDIAAFTPGITITDTGPRGAGTIIMRGLSADDSSAGGNNSDNAIGIYLGDVPLYTDYKLIDLERVETLLGPQGTLYGLGTLAGAVRYIPNRPDPTKFSGEAYGRLYDVAHSKGVGYVGYGVLNLPIVQDAIAFRTVTGYYYDPGFIDYPYLLKEPGVSLPQPGDTSNPMGTDAQQSANFAGKKDLNFEKTFTSRNQLGFVSPDFQAYFTYAYQETKTDGRQATGAGVVGEGKYEAPWRYKEPSKRMSHLISLELQGNVYDVAQAIFVSAYTNKKQRSSTDVTDLLLDLDYDYELFPSFSGYTRSRGAEEQYNQEVRLVSTHGGPFSWVIGGFWNRLNTRSDYREIVPGYPAWAGINRPDEVEYASYVNTKTDEKAVFGEGSFKITPEWQVTAGVRYFKYSADVIGGTALPLFQAYPNINFRSRAGSTSDDGTVWKFNSSYNITPDLMVWGTYSKGYRIGGVNRVAPCVLPLPAGQNLCALPSELFYGPDKVKNAEIGVRAQLFERKLSMSLSAFRVKWDGIQLSGQTVNGAIGITTNGGAAISKGVDFSFSAKPIDGLTIRGNYSYLDAHLTEDVPALLSIAGGDLVDVLAGDRLPGSTKNSGAIGVSYDMPMGDNMLNLGWTTTYTGGIYTRPGLRGGGERLPSYMMSRANITYKTDIYEIGLFANNIFDKYAITGVSNDLTRFGLVNDGIISRYYARSVAQPRVIGVEGRVKF
ncbi:TonB-dependent receptor [Sphingobium sp. TCM1]|jgi:outer membrane receptor protein involved in Fe transport|uniref:TonB-dependent receptor n=1 Tax=Sphingobium sp. TCM1 TaxID=453246 RepID=UPI0007F48D68|nr:TonB-dependent receptor [Sphingobium sp. TCM1]OAN57916.1 TonB-dependent receptor [Sphingobium sp. TCM1]